MALLIIARRRSNGRRKLNLHKWYRICFHSSHFTAFLPKACSSSNSVGGSERWAWLARIPSTRRWAASMQPQSNARDPIADWIESFI
jgi:hypothetical protein